MAKLTTIPVNRTEEEYKDRELVKVALLERCPVEVQNAFARIESRIVILKDRLETAQSEVAELSDILTRNGL